MRADSTHRRGPILITFSGLDGSGKSTQIESLRRELNNRGYKTVQLAFWDDVVVLSNYREEFVHKVFKSEKGIGAPGKPVNRRDKNVRGWYLTPLRLCLYLMDAIHLRSVIAKHCGPNLDAIIMDRYIYDELANLPLDSPLVRRFVHITARLVPTPNVAYLLDADPSAAHARKPEYPLQFMHECRRSYLTLAAILGNVIVIAPQSLDAATQEVTSVLNAKLNFVQPELLPRPEAA